MYHTLHTLRYHTILFFFGIAITKIINWYLDEDVIKISTRVFFLSHVPLRFITKQFLILLLLLLHTHLVLKYVVYIYLFRYMHMFWILCGWATFGWQMFLLLWSLLIAFLSQNQQERALIENDNIEETGMEVVWWWRERKIRNTQFYYNFIDFSSFCGTSYVFA